MIHMPFSSSRMRPPICHLAHSNHWLNLLVELIDQTSCRSEFIKARTQSNSNKVDNFEMRKKRKFED